MRVGRKLWRALSVVTIVLVCLIGGCLGVLMLAFGPSGTLTVEIENRLGRPLTNGRYIQDYSSPPVALKPPFDVIPANGRVRGRPDGPRGGDIKLVYTFPDVGDRTFYCGYMDNDYDLRVKVVAEADSFSTIGDTLMHITDGKVVWAKP